MHCGTALRMQRLMAKRTRAETSESARYRVNPQLITRRVAESTVVCLAAHGSLQSRAVTTRLDATATAILELLQSPHDVGSLTSEVADGFGADIDVVRADVAAALQVFVRNDWVLAC